MDNEQTPARIKSDLLGQLLTCRCMLEMIIEKHTPLAADLTSAIDTLKLVSSKIDAMGKKQEPAPVITTLGTPAPLPSACSIDEPDCEACQ